MDIAQPVAGIALGVDKSDFSLGVIEKEAYQLAGSVAGAPDYDGFHWASGLFRFSTLW